MARPGGAHSVSVIIPHKDRPEFLARALRSVMLQRVLPIDIVVIDDGSTYENLQKARRICEAIGKQSSIEFLVNSRNMGANFSRNRGIASAQGEYLAFLDSDDVWLPEKLDQQMLALAREARPAGLGVLCYTGRYRAASAGEIIACQVPNRKLPQSEILFTNFIGTLSSVLVDRASVIAVGGFDESLGASQDWDLYIRLRRRVKFVRVPQPLCVYYDHDQSRISKANQDRVRSNMILRRKHISRGAKLSDRTDYCRMMAEDLQLAGRKGLAQRFYLHRYSRAGFGQPLKRLNQIADCLRVLVFGLPDIKGKRYAGYRRQLAKLLRSEDVRSAFFEDQRFILNLHQTVSCDMCLFPDA